MFRAGPLLLVLLAAFGLRLGFAPLRVCPMLGGTACCCRTDRLPPVPVRRCCAPPAKPAPAACCARHDAEVLPTALPQPPAAPPQVTATVPPTVAPAVLIAALPAWRGPAPATGPPLWLRFRTILV